MELQQKIESRIKNLSRDIDSKRAVIIEMANNKDYFDIPGIIKQCEGLNILFNQLLQLQDLSVNEVSLPVSISKTTCINRRSVTNHRIKLRLKRLMYKSRKVFCQNPTNNKLIVAIQQKMNRLLKSWKSGHSENKHKNL